MLRIIAGEFKHRRLATPEGKDRTRPIPDRVRESLFSMLRGHLENEVVADFFAGSGSFGLEAISRGASQCLFVEKDREAARVLKQNIETLSVPERCDVFVGDALGLGALSRCPSPIHLIFFDPPYPLIEDPEGRRRIFDQFASLIERLDDTGYAILRTPWPFRESAASDGGSSPRKDLSLAVRGAMGPETHPYGSTALHWYMRARSAD